MEMQTELFLKLLIHVKRVTQGWGLLYHRFDLIMQEGEKNKQNIAWVECTICTLEENKSYVRKLKILTDCCFSPHSGKNKSLMFVHEFHLLAAECHWRSKGAVLTGALGNSHCVPHPTWQQKKGDAGKLAEFQCLSLNLTDFFLINQ